ncbi:MAG: 50S ribosomal protein L5 [Patescibacteria group bacterium]
MSLQERFVKEIAPALAKKLGSKNVNAIPKPVAVTIAIGISPSKHKDGKLLEFAQNSLERISGQRPVQTKARKSISNFKTRAGQVIGLKVTLRGKRMWDFLEKLVDYTFPRVRDFRGISPKVVDHSGSASFGFTEHLAFPEIRSDEVERVHGLQVTVTTTATSAASGLALFEALGFPFKK